MSIKKLFAATFLFAILVSPLSVHAIPFGARVASIPIQCDGSGYMVRAQSVFGPSFWLIFGTGSRAYLFGPPKLIGQWTLGTGNLSVCTVNKVPFQGILIDSSPGVGTSLY